MKPLSLAALLCSAISFIGCGGDQVKAGGSVLPAWYMKGTPGCAVAAQKFRGNLSLAESGAIGKARTKLARQFQVEIRGMLKQYAAEGGTDKGDMSEELTEDATRQITKMTLVGTRTVKQELSQGQPQQMFVRVCIKPDEMIKALDKLKQLNPAAINALKENARETFKELDKFTK
ncbi:MAG: hypothetical protein CMH52_10395 [Myxococcales bacterium]|nr:hypothetical protein [Myxococcales bacterium]|tara:strand:- start:554 stop:1078 length:525 start_codon:yes stop_codon:yes gene_type:complete